MRSETIATYALCGFANLSSIGVQLGGIGPMAPSRRSDLASLAIRALICGTTACFVTACVAGNVSIIIIIIVMNDITMITKTYKM